MTFRVFSPPFDFAQGKRRRKERQAGRTFLRCALTLFSLSALILPAQNYKSDLLLASKVFTSDKLQIDSKVEVYENYSSAQPSETIQASVKKDGVNYFSDAGNLKMLLNGKYLVMAYDDEKRIAYTKASKNAEESLRHSTDASATIDSMLTRKDSVVYKGIHGSDKVYIIYTGKSMIRRTEVWFDTRTSYIHKLVYYYNEQVIPTGNKVIIIYSFNTQPQFSADEFSESRFIRFSHGSAVAADTYKNYSVEYIEEP